MSRKQSREQVFKLLYQLAFSKEFKFEMEEEVTGVELEYIQTLCNHVVANLSSIDEMIERLSKGFKIDRIFSVDLTVLRMAIAEILYMPTPNNVIVDTCLTLVKKYSTDKSNSFVNGILASVLKETNTSSPK